MRTGRAFTRGLALAAGIAWTLTLWPGAVAAGHDHSDRKKRHHRHREHPRVVVVQPPACRPVPPPQGVWRPACEPVHVRTGCGQPACRQHAPEQPVCRAPLPRTYYDPYCRMHYDSLGLYVEHARAHWHVGIVWVMEGGRPLYASQYTPRGWVRCGG